MSGSKSTTVPVRGNRTYANAVGLVARKRNMMIADLVRMALNASYGSEIEEAEKFFADGDTQKTQTNHISTEEPTHVG